MVRQTRCSQRSIREKLDKFIQSTSLLNTFIVFKDISIGYLSEHQNASYPGPDMKKKNYMFLADCFYKRAIQCFKNELKKKKKYGQIPLAICQDGY